MASANAHSGRRLLTPASAEYPYYGRVEKSHPTMDQKPTASHGVPPNRVAGFLFAESNGAVLLSFGESRCGAVRNFYFGFHTVRRGSVKTVKKTASFRIVRCSVARVFTFENHTVRCCAVS